MLYALKNFSKKSPERCLHGMVSSFCQRETGSLTLLRV
nr:MAG TPA: hypothetical protein [Caudoviricetes sp.]